MKTDALARTISLLILLPVVAIAQVQRDAVPLQSWPAPLYWQPSQSEHQAAVAERPGVSAQAIASDIGPAATSPANSLVFVGMTPCRVVDTRTGSGFSGAFGPPSLVGGAVRSFPIQSSTTCSIPAIAQAYSFNITLVTFSFVDFITVWPTGQAQPNASTLNGYVNTVIANAAIVPAGTGGSIDVYASQNTHLVIDINGFYAPQSGITLAQGTAGAPSLSFTGDPGTGLFSSGAGTLNLAAGGTSRISVAANGEVNLTALNLPDTVNSLTGVLKIGGSPFLHKYGSPVNTFVGASAGNFSMSGNYNTAVGASALAVNTLGSSNTATGPFALGSNTQGFQNTANGVRSLQSNTTGYSNTATGAFSLQNNTTGNFNTANGTYALEQNTGGMYNTATGLTALGSNTFGGNNTAVGSRALRLNTNGVENTAVGESAMFENGGGHRNTAVGYLAGVTANSVNANTFGSNNTFIGYQSGPGTNIQLSNATAIGSNALVSASNALVLGDSSVSVGIGTSIPTAKLDVNGGVRLNTTEGKPSCDATTRGTFWFTQGGAGVKDSAEVCAKDSGNAYAWRTLY
jgi:hypothetical protein